MNINELLVEWLYENHQHKIKPRTLLRYETILNNHIYLDYGDTNIIDINPRLLQHWINEIKEKVNMTSINIQIFIKYNVPRRTEPTRLTQLLHQVMALFLFY